MMENSLGLWFGTYVHGGRGTGVSTEHLNNGIVG